MPGKRIIFSNDQELVEALRKGDKRGLEQIYIMCFGAFAAYVRSGGGSREDAEDCFQEGVMSVWVNVQQGRYDLRETASFKTYVLGVCKYKWMNKLRSAYRKNMSLTSELPDIPAITTEELYEERLQHLNINLSALGSLCQDILKMFYFEKLSYEEMEKRTGKTAESLKNQKYRCINRLRELMQQMESQKP
jgi:RNA polymerase sigma factor (sigma-70 family)